MPAAEPGYGAVGFYWDGNDLDVVESGDGYVAVGTYGNEATV